MKRITGRLAEDKGKYYAVINLPSVDGKRKTKWHTLNLEAKKGNKKEAQYRLNQILDKYNAGDVHLAETMTHADRERNRLANTKMLDYLDEWLEGHQHDIERETYHQYKRYIDGRIREFFTPLDLTVKDLSGDEINEFYTADCQASATPKNASNGESHPKHFLGLKLIDKTTFCKVSLSKE